jgi:hypothetical protein
MTKKISRQPRDEWKVGRMKVFNFSKDCMSSSLLWICQLSLCLELSFFLKDKAKAKGVLKGFKSYLACFRFFFLLVGILSLI